jgi:L-methionine (R)-S-oxide reductase
VISRGRRGTLGIAQNAQSWFVKLKMADSFLLEKISALLRKDLPRATKVQAIAEAIRIEGSYRWTGIYDVDMSAGTVSNVAWSGPAAPEYPTFAVTQGLTSRAISAQATVNVGNVREDADYLTALATTRSEIIVPVIAVNGRVVGTLDVESEIPNAFDPETQKKLENCAQLLTRFWD